MAEMIVQRRKIIALKLNKIFFLCVNSVQYFFSSALKISNSLFKIVTLNRAKKISLFQFLTYGFQTLALVLAQTKNGLRPKP